MKSLQVKNLYLQYNFATLALQNINFDISKGQVLTVLAPQESGKTSLTNALAGLVKVTKGQVIYNGKDISGLPAKARNVSVMHADLGLFKHKTVLYNLLYPFKIRKIDPSLARTKVDTQLDAFGLTDIKDCKVNKLSTQDQVAVAVARLFARESNYYLIDDPLYIFKGEQRTAMFAWLLPHIKALSKIAPVIYATSSIAETKTLKESVLLLNYGVQLQSGDLDSITARPRSVLAYRLFREHAVVEESRIINGARGVYLSLGGREVAIDQDKLINDIYVDSDVLACYTLKEKEIDQDSMLLFDKNSEKLIYFD